MKEEKILFNFGFRFCIRFVVVLLFLFFLESNAKASTFITDGYFGGISNEWSEDFYFDWDGDGVPVIFFYADFENEGTANKSDGVEFVIKRIDEGRYYDSSKFYFGAGNEDMQCWFTPVEEVLPSGGYCVSFEGLTNREISISYTLDRYSSYISSLSMPNVINMKTDDDEIIEFKDLFPSGAYLRMDFESSNTTVADVTYNPKTCLGYVYAHKKGTCIITATLMNGKQYKCTVKVTNPSPRLEYKKYTMYVGDKLKNKVKYTTKKPKWSSSNKSIATVSSSGKITAKKLGSCTITAKIGKKKYKCTIKVVRQDPNYTAYINDYNTRNNYFEVVVRNYSNKPLTIYQTAKACDKDYKSYDRNLKLSGGNVTIKPGKKKTLKFKVKGRTTWYNENDFWIDYKIKFDGKVYAAYVNTDVEDGGVKKGKSWYYTYWKNVTPTY